MTSNTDNTQLNPPIPPPVPKTQELAPFWEQWCTDLATLLDGSMQLVPLERVNTWHNPLQAYYTTLQTVNQHTNLTRIDDVRGFLWRHVLDSLSLLPWIPSGAKVLDLGTGAGFPAIPLALARPDITVLAVDSVHKKCLFIESVIQTLELSNIQVWHGRCEELAHQDTYRAQFDVVTARAVAALNTLLELGLPFLHSEGVLLAMKQQTALDTELPQAQQALNCLNGVVLGTVPCPLEALKAHVVVSIRRNGNIPTSYPRLKNKPRKKPL